MRQASVHVRAFAVAALAWGAAVGAASAQALTTRISTTSVGAQLAGASRQPSASADGRFVAFSSTDTTLVAGDGNGSADIFVKDRQTGAVTRVSLRTGGLEAVGDSTAPDISADGRFVAFTSVASLTADDTNVSSCPGGLVAAPTCPDVFVHDRVTGETTRASVNSGGAQGDGASVAPRISGNGRYVVFESLASNLVAGDTNQIRDVFRHDRQTSTTTRVSVATSGAQADRAAMSPTISDDGNRIAFLSEASTLDDGADTLACDAAQLPCSRAYVRTAAATARVRFLVSYPGLTGIATQAHRVTEAVLSGDGETVTAIVYGSITLQNGGPLTFEALGTASLAAGTPAAVVASGAGVNPPRLSSLAVDTGGRFQAFCNNISDIPPGFLLLIFDRQTWVSGSGQGARIDCQSVTLSGDGLTVFFASVPASTTPLVVDGAEVLEAAWFPVDDLPRLSANTALLLGHYGIGPDAQ